LKTIEEYLKISKIMYKTGNINNFDELKYGGLKRLILDSFASRADADAFLV